jgi:hypothetical protein
MAISFDRETQCLVFRPEYLTETPALPILVRKDGRDVFTIYPDTATQEEMVDYFVTHNLWHLFDVLDNF